ncbi:MAG: NAD(P)-binding protein [Myxococcales bacterium]|nr:NAD(P)-binding protein [Myxococcales bacterium]
MGKERIAILGGGVSAMTTAFYLSSYPGWQDDWEIDVYQLGWRLGGKGASGRNAAMRHRIEEHGLHIFLGFYDNAFATMQRLYRELGRGPDEPLATWDAAWKPQQLVVFMEHLRGADGGERWEPWPVEFPGNGLTPGTGGEWPSGWDYVTMMLEWIQRWLVGGGLLGEPRPDVVERLVGDVLTTTEAHPGASGDLRVSELLAGLAQRVADTFVSGVQYLAGLTTLDDQLIYAATRLASLIGSSQLTDSRHSALVVMLRRLRAWVWGRVADVIDHDPGQRRMFVMVDLCVAAITGMIDAGLVGGDPYWFKLDGEGFRSWIMRHGAARQTAYSAPIEAAYALAFGEQTELGAGTAMHGILRLMLGYKGAIFWEMQAGMGDTIFAPMYEVLRRRGVRFHFFHRVDRLELAADRRTVAKVHIGRPIGVKGDAPYRPLYDVKGLPCWPSAPRYDQLDGGDALAASGCDLEDWWTPWVDRLPPRVLEHGVDFDRVILGTAVATFPYVAREVMDASPRFKAMAEGVVTTQTQAMQLWFRPDLRGLGCPWPKPIVGSYALWMDTWADLTHLLEREDWPPGKVPGNLAYLVSRLVDDEPLPPRSDHGYTARQLARVRASALAWLRREVAPLWPHATQTHDPRCLNWYFLVDEQERDGEARLDAQYLRATVNPSERYVLSEPGTTRLRLRAEETDVDNLLHVGDHTFTGINAGCVEAAVMSGMNAAQFLCGHPTRIVGDILPRRGPWGER